MNTDEFSLRRALAILRGTRTPSLQDCAVVEAEFDPRELEPPKWDREIIELLTVAREFI